MTTSTTLLRVPQSKRRTSAMEAPSEREVRWVECRCGAAVLMARPGFARARCRSCERRIYRWIGRRGAAVIVLLIVLVAGALLFLERDRAGGIFSTAETWASKVYQWLAAPATSSSDPVQPALTAWPLVAQKLANGNVELRLTNTTDSILRVGLRLDRQGRDVELFPGETIAVWVPPGRFTILTQSSRSDGLILVRENVEVAAPGSQITLPE